MIKKFFTICISSMIILFSFNLPAFGAPTGSVKGTIMDAQSKEPLPYSNVIIVGTSMGAAADKDGKFNINGIPVGHYTLRATFVGYKQKEVKVDIRARRTLEFNFFLEPAAVEGKTVMVTAQAEGQMQAINKQLSAMSIKNVVSSAKIQQLPDANAAESVGRLPGVSLVREGGEASQVVIRGLAPQYNQITIDGIQLPSNIASGNLITSTDLNSTATNSSLGDRAVDLSMISSSSLGGIEVVKAITPDMDAAVLGGVVNFDLRKAGKSTHKLMPKIGLLAQGAYNQLKNEANDYKYVASIENRYFNDHFGVFLQGSMERRNLSDQQFGAAYTVNNVNVNLGDATIPNLDNLTLTDTHRIRKRDDGTLVLDYRTKDIKIGLENVMSYSDTKATNRSEQAYIWNASRELNYGLNNADTKLNSLTSLLSVDASIPFFNVHGTLAYSYSRSQDPGDATFNFVQDYGGFTGGIGSSVAKLQPNVIASYIQPNDTAAWLDNIITSNSLLKDRFYEGKIDFTHDFNISDFVTAKFKFGGMYQDRTRSYVYGQRSGSTIYNGGSVVTTAFRNRYPNLLFNSTGLSMANFVYNGYSYGNFLKGEYNMVYPLNADLMRQLIPITMTENASLGGGFRANDIASRVNNYNGVEDKSAVYGMLTLNLGNMFTLLPGVRYQNLKGTYTAARVNLTVPGGVYSDTSVTKSHGYVLPMVHLIIKPLDWLQVHFAYTNTLNYPDFTAITPRYEITNTFINVNNYNLKPATSQNFDLVVSAYSNDIGLLTLDGFSKQIKNLVFYSNTWVTDLSKFPELPNLRGNLWNVATYINSPYTITLNGLEADWQTHFWYLPGVLSGIVLSVNYTHIFSKANYPKTIKYVKYDEYGNTNTTIVDTFYTDRLIDQPTDIANLAVGFDYKGFSIRVSMIYHADVFQAPGFIPAVRSIGAKYTRWDMSAKQELPWYKIQVFFNLNNINSEDDIYKNAKTDFLSSQQRYGLEAELGLRVSM